jgi:hypothetical protein
VAVVGGGGEGLAAPGEENVHRLVLAWLGLAWLGLCRKWRCFVFGFWLFLLRGFGFQPHFMQWRPVLYGRKGASIRDTSESHYDLVIRTRSFCGHLMIPGIYFGFG